MDQTDRRFKELGGRGTHYSPIIYLLMTIVHELHDGEGLFGMYLNYYLRIDE